MKPKELYDQVVKPLIDAQMSQDALHILVKSATVDPAAYAKDVLGFSESIVSMFLHDLNGERELLAQIVWELQERFDVEYVIRMRTDKIEQATAYADKRHALALALRIADPFIDQLYTVLDCAVLSVEADNDEDLRFVQQLAAEHYDTLIFVRDSCLCDTEEDTYDAVNSGEHFSTVGAKDFCSTFRIAWGDDVSPQRAIARWLMQRYHK